MQATGFLPSRDGFSFRNDFDYPASRLGRAAPLAPGFGLAAGMCLAALDRWQAGRPLPVLPSAPAPGDVLYEELVRRQVELLGHGAWDQILDWQGRPGVGGLFGPRGVGELTRTEWSRVRRSIERGMPALLCVVRTRGPFANPSENPVVLAYRYEYARDTKRGTIWVYDPNRPGNDDVRLTIVATGRRRSPEVMFMAERVRGFMVLPHDRPVAAPFRAIELADAESGGFIGRAIGLPGRGANAAVRAKNGGVLLVRGGKNVDTPPRLQLSGAEEPLASDLALIPGALPTIVARGSDGNLLGLRVGVRGWRPRLLPSPKAPLQLDYGPVVFPHRGRVHVFGVQKGRLAHLRRSRAGKWTAGIVPGQTGAGNDPLEGMPAALVAKDGLVRVFTRTEKGRVAMMTLSKEGQWTTMQLPAADAPIAGDPIAVIAPDDDQISVLAVTEAGELVQTRGSGSGAWRVRNLARETAREGGAQPIRVEIAVTDGPGNTLHVFGVSPRGGLIHYWCPPTLAWRSQDLTHGRAEVGDIARVRGRPSAVRTGDDQIIVAAAAEKGIVVYRWSTTGDWTGDVLPLPPSLSDRATLDGPVLWRDARGQAHLHAVLDDGTAVLGVPGRPESEHRAMRMDSIAAVQPPKREMPVAGTAEAALEPVVEAPLVEPDLPIAAMPVAAIPVTEFSGPVPMDLPGGLEPVAPGAVTLDIPETVSTEPLSFESFGAMELPPDDVQTQTLDIPAEEPIASGVGLLDLGSMAASDEAVVEETGEIPTLDIGFGTSDPSDAARGTKESRTTPARRDDATDREGWGSYGEQQPSEEGSVDLGSMAFEPAAPLMRNDEDSDTITHLDLPDDPTLPGTTPARPDPAAEAREVERKRVAAERAEAERLERERAAAERERIAAEKAAAEQAERDRIAAEKAAAEEAERERLAAERKAAEVAERERLAAEKRAAEKAERERIAAEKRAAEKAERERIAAEKRAAEEAERQRIAAEKAAAEAAERERIAAEKAAAEEAERQRIAAEKAAAEEKAERERLAAEKKAAEEAAKEAERQRIAAEKAAAESAERERIAAEKAAAEEAERQRIAAEKAAAEEAERTRIAAEEAERERVAAEKEAARLAAEQEAQRREEERAAKKAEAERAAHAKDKHAKHGKKGHAAKADKHESKKDAPRSGRVIPAALEGLPLLDDEIKPREPKPADSAPAEEKKPKEQSKPKPRLRSVEEMIRLSDEHGPTIDKK